MQNFVVLDRRIIEIEVVQSHGVRACFDPSAIELVALPDRPNSKAIEGVQTRMLRTAAAAKRYSLG